MAKGIRSHRRISSRLRSAPYPLPSHRMGVSGNESSLNKLALEKKDWQHATCSVCMEFPHNAVLLLCSSHDKGCRPYMCGTSFRHSNCLDQFKKAYAKAAPTSETNVENSSLSLITPGWPTCKKPEGIELACPLCRGQVKGWTVVEPAREYLNKKRRSCMQDNCSFMGTYRELQKHVRVEHPCAKPRKVDPLLEQKWMTMEHQREREDIISSLTASNTRSVVMGDYLIELDTSESDTDDEELHEGDRGFLARNRRAGASFLYFLLREGALLTGLNRNSEAFDSTEDGGGAVPLTDSTNTAANADDDIYDLEDDDVEARPEMLVNILRSERQQRRRSGGRSAPGVS